MSDDQTPVSQSNDKDLIQQVTEKLNARTRRENCLYCDNTEWFFLNADEKKPCLMFEDLRHYPTYAFSCTNCGFIRQHIKATLDGVVVREPKFVAPEGEANGE